MSIIIGEFVNNLENNKLKKSYKPFNESSNIDRDIIIFDLGSVLIDGDFDITLHQDPRIPNDRIEEIKSYWCIKNNPNFTETCTKDQYLDAVKKSTPDDLKYLIPTVAEISSSYLEILPHTYSLINNLRRDGYSIYYLSNWNKWSIEELKNPGKLDFLSLFDGGLFSYECGYLKPDERIYITLLKKYNLDPNKCIFFDDKQENINAANKLGIEGILFNKDEGDNILQDYLINNPLDQKDLDISSFAIDNLTEAAMSSKERNALSDDEFGIPSQRKYPLNDKKHVEQAIKMFNHVEKKYESELADNLLDAMEKYHISTNTVGDSNRLKKYIKEETLYEGLIWNDNTPKDIKELKENINKFLNTPEKMSDLLNIAKDSLKDIDFTSEEKQNIYKALTKNHVNIQGYTIKTSNYGAIEISNTHTIIGTYKNYILSFKFMSAKGNSRLTEIIIKYDSCNNEIPKEVAFDTLSMISPDVSNVRCTKHSIKISGVAKAIDSVYPRIDHKYSKKYNIKKIPGMCIKISTLKTVKEDSLIAAALPREDFQPNSVYIINYLKNNAFNDIAICKDKMNSIFICNNDKPEVISLTDFKEIASNIKVYKYIGDCNFKEIIESSNSGLDFYRNMINDNTVEIDNIKTDYHFTEVSSYIDELNSIAECIINSAPRSGVVNEIYCPIIPLINLNEEYSSVQYFRDIDGVFAENVDNLMRSASYTSVDQIPKTTLNILKNI